MLQVRPLRRQLATLKAWITGQRKDQSPGTRSGVPVVEVTPPPHLVRPQRDESAMEAQHLSIWHYAERRPVILILRIKQQRRLWHSSLQCPSQHALQAFAWPVRSLPTAAFRVLPAACGAGRPRV